jgi:hypothetical protein
MGRPPRKVSIAKALGVSGASVTRYLRRGMPCTSIEAAIAWRDENIPPGLWRTGAASAGATPPAGEAAPATDAARLLRHKAAREEHEAALALMRRLEVEGRTLLMDDHKRIVFELSRRIRDALLQFPSRAAALVAAEREQAACQRILDAEVRAVLAQLARVGPPPANGGEGGPLQ